MLIARWGGLLLNHRRSPPQRAIAGLCIVTMRRVANNLEFMGQQWYRIFFWQLSPVLFLDSNRAFDPLYMIPQETETHE